MLFKIQNFQIIICRGISHENEVITAEKTSCILFFSLVNLLEIILNFMLHLEKNGKWQQQSFMFIFVHLCNITHCVGLIPSVSNRACYDALKIWKLKGFQTFSWCDHICNLLLFSHIHHRGLVGFQAAELPTVQLDLSRRKEGRDSPSVGGLASEKTEFWDKNNTRLLCDVDSALETKTGSFTVWI